TCMTQRRKLQEKPMAKPSADPTEYLASLFAAGQQMMNPLSRLPEEPPEPKAAAAAAPKQPAPARDETSAAPEQPAAGAPANDPFAAFAQATKSLAELQQDYLRQVTDFWMSVPAAFGMPGIPGMPPVPGFPGTELPAGAADDRRFAGEAWRSDP